MHGKRLKRHTWTFSSCKTTVKLTKSWYVVHKQNLETQNPLPPYFKFCVSCWCFTVSCRFILCRRSRLVHLPSFRWLSAFSFLLKKLRFLHDFHLLKFMMLSNLCTVQKGAKKRKETKNRPGRGGQELVVVMVVKEEEQESKEKEEVEVWGCLPGLFIWGGWCFWCDITHTWQEGERSEWQEQALLQLVN